RQGPIGEQVDIEALGGAQQAWHGPFVLNSGEQAIAAYAPVPSVGGGVLMAVPIEHALHSLHQLKWRAIGLGGLFALLLIVVALVIAGRLVRPLKTVVAASQRMALGARGVNVPVDGPEELGELGRAFNQMSTALKTSEDLLEQRVAERTYELKQAREFAELLLDSFEQSVVVIDRDLRITRANQAAARLFSRELVGQDCAVLCSGREGPCDECAVRDTFARARAAYAERSQQVGMGQEILRIESFPVLAADGRVDAVVQIGRIVTAERRLQAQMIHQEKMAAFGLLAAGIAHEIGNPLAAIMSQLRSARSDAQPEHAERGPETLRIVEQQVERISRLLRELVNLTRRRPADLTLVDVNLVVVDVGRLLAHDPRARHIRIEQSLLPHLPGVRAKEDELVQVMLNLGLNALDAMPEGGALSFETASFAHEIVVRVRDTGSGIAEDAQLRLFEPFFTTKMPGRGTGLGLFVSRGIVEALGGRLLVETTGNSGTVFAVHLPARESHSRAEVA
ncbi:MAG: HAMP domain-containing protein, partial [Deltaproteobacteria bacterium]|nr:HAMP domain-containing protein [Deltaproteobacteria bacterium]